MNTNDVLLVAADLRDFTAVDLAHALDVPIGTAGGWLSVAARKGFVVRIRCGKTYLYTLSGRSLRRLAKLPPVDPDERALPLSWEGITPCDCVHDKPTRVRKSIVGMINHGATQVIEEQVYCATCGAWWSSARYTNTPF